MKFTWRSTRVAARKYFTNDDWSHASGAFVIDCIPRKKIRSILSILVLFKLRDLLQFLKTIVLNNSTRCLTCVVFILYVTDVLYGIDNVKVFVKINCNLIHKNSTTSPFLFSETATKIQWVARTSKQKNRGSWRIRCQRRSRQRVISDVWAR